MGSVIVVDLFNNTAVLYREEGRIELEYLHDLNFPYLFDSITWHCKDQLKAYGYAKVSRSSLAEALFIIKKEEPSS